MAKHLRLGSGSVVVVSLLAFGFGRAEATRQKPPPVSSLVGDTSCAFGAKDCNRCVSGVVAAVAGLRPRPSAFVGYSSMASRALPPYGARLAPFAANDSHLEGIARLPATDASWLVVSRARPGKPGGGGFFLVQLGDVPHRDGAPFGSARRPARYMEPNPALRRTRYYHPVDDGDHPGGLQLLGRTLALAVSCASWPGCGGRAFVQLDDLSDPSAKETLIERIPLFAQGEPHAAAHATSVAVAKLRDGHHLMFVQGKDDRREGWFYESDAPELGPTTQWRYLQHFRGDASFDGAYQMTTLLSDCDSGKLYLLGAGNPSYRPTLRPRWSPAVFGELISFVVEGSVEPGRELLHLFELRERGGEIELARVLASAWRPDRDAFCSFRAGASAYVTPEGRLALYCTTRKANTDFFGTPDSKLKFAEFASE